MDTSAASRIGNENAGTQTISPGKRQANEATHETAPRHWIPRLSRKPRLKKLQDQVVVITGASSGIGLVTARQAAKKGARLVLASRSGDALQQLVDEIQAQGGEAVFVVADVGREDEVRMIADAAIPRFGGFDTWINNAGAAAYGRLDKVPIDDQRRIFDTNYWGVVYGSLAAAEHFRNRGEPGAIINIGSILSDISFPLQGAYSASKHAVKGFTDALRMELEEEGWPIAVTLVKPSAIDTPYVEHAANYMEVQAKNPPPYYAPDVVARTILHCCEHPERELVVGGRGRLMVGLGKNAPRFAERYTERTAFKGQRTDEPEGDPLDHALRIPGGQLQERGARTQGRVYERSAYTAAAMHPMITLAAVMGVGVGIGLLWRQWSRMQQEREHDSHLLSKLAAAMSLPALLKTAKGGVGAAREGLIAAKDRAACAKERWWG